MKKYLMGFIAIALAVGFSAFTANKKMAADKLDGLYWYSSTSGTAFPGNPQVEPSPDCLATGSNCALGFTGVQTDPIGNIGNVSQTRSHN